MSVISLECLVVLLCLPVFALSNLVAGAQALQSGMAPWLVCANGVEAAQVAARNMPPEPAENATVTAGAAVTFSGESKEPLVFNIASTPALLATPDIDSGTGTLQQQASAPFYVFSSAKASATPRTIYWTASFTFTPEDCEAPTTFTSPVHTLMIAPSPAEVAAVKQQQEEQAARKQQEERAAAQKAAEEAAAHGNVLLGSSTVHVRGRHSIAVKLTCADVAACAGKLNVTIKRPAGKRLTSETLASGHFSIPAGKTAMVTIALIKRTLTIPASAHGHLTATLTITRTSPAPQGIQVKRVRLQG